MAHVTRTGFKQVNCWVTVTNKWPDDEAHERTCLIMVRSTKPTARLVRKHRKAAHLMTR